MRAKIKNRDAVDIVKYIMSVLIVATHTSLFEGKLTPLVRLAVPVFFVFSGYFFFERVAASEQGKATAVLKNTLRRNLQLYAFWFAVLLPITLYVRNYISAGAIKGTLELLKNFILGSTFQSSWYIMALVIGVTVLFFLSRKAGNSVLTAIGIIMYIPCLLASNYYFIVQSSELAVEIYSDFVFVFSLPCRNFFVSILYLTLGKILSENKVSKNKTGDFLLFILCFALMTAEYALLNISGAEIINTDCFIMLPLTVFYFCKWVLSLDVSCKQAIVFRNISTVSYCSHMAVFMVVGKVFKLLHIPDLQNVLLFGVTLLLTQTLALIIIKISEFKNFRILKYSY